MMWRPTNPASKLIARALIVAHRSNAIELPAPVAALCIEALVTRTLTPGERIRLGMHWKEWGPQLQEGNEARSNNELALAIAV